MKSETLKILDQLCEKNLISEERKQVLMNELSQKFQGRVPWFVRALVGLGAWVASLLLLLFFELANVFHSPEITIVFGIFLLMVTTSLRFKVSTDFGIQLSLAMNLVGHFLTILGVEQIVDQPWITALITFVLELVIFAFYPDAVMRFVTALGSAVSLLIAGIDGEIPLFVDIVVGLSFFGAGFLWLAPLRWDLTKFRKYRHPASFALFIFVLGFLSLQLGFEDLHKDRISFPLLTVMFGLSVALWSAYISRKHFIKGAIIPYVILVSTILLLSMASYRVPGIMAAMGVFLLAFERKSHFLFGVATIFLVGFTFFLYYDLELTLLLKSGVLFGTGVILLLVSALIRFQRNPNAKGVL